MQYNMNCALTTEYQCLHYFKKAQHQSKEVHNKCTETNSNSVNDSIDQSYQAKRDITDAQVEKVETTQGNK